MKRFYKERGEFLCSGKANSGPGWPCWKNMTIVKKESFLFSGIFDIDNVLLSAFVKK